MTDNIVRFPKAKRPAPASVALNGARLRALLPSANTVFAAVIAILAGSLMLVRMALFLVLYWLRLPVMLVGNLISVPATFAWLFAWYAFPDKPHMVWGLCAFSLTAFVCLWVYDSVLALLMPAGMIINR